MTALETTSADRPPAARALVSAVLGGALGWTLLFAGLQYWGPVIGLAVTVGTVLAFTRLRISSQPFRAMTGFALAFVLLSWPVLWIGIGYVRYLLTGQALGN